jgi:molybdopterin/thiamine biosynthesis adenylyltransferase
MNAEAARLFARIAPLFDVGALSSTRVLIAGCGSGGGNVALQLAMSGLVHFILVDKDILEPENVIRHVCGIRHLGMPKVDAVADLLLDRNPRIEIAKHSIDVMDDEFEDLVRGADVVVLATDNEPSRWRINELCVRTATPFCVARVFTRGIGGEVFSYRPGEGGCLACLESVLQRTQFRVGIKEVDLVSEDEREAMYGLDVAEIKDSPGLNVDISFIASFHTRFVLEAIGRGLAERPKYLIPIDENYLVWGNRPVAPFEKHFQVQRISLSPQHGCAVCGNSEVSNAV